MTLIVENCSLLEIYSPIEFHLSNFSLSLKYYGMRGILKYTLSVLILIFFASCKKEEAATAAVNEVAQMSELRVDPSFSWSASLSGNLDVNFLNPDNISLDREYLYLEDVSGAVLEKVQIDGASASFKLKLPANGNYQVHFPYSGQVFPINGPGSYQFTAEHLSQKTGSIRSGGSCTVCNSSIENNLAELPAIPNRTYRILSESQVPGWETTAPDGKIEVWSSGFNGVPAQEGRQFFEINANYHPNAALFQSLCLEPGSTIRWSVYHRARVGTDVARVLIGADVNTATEQAIMSSTTSAWSYYSGTYVVPANQTTTVFMFEAVSTGSGNSSVGNFLDNFRIECDEDGDGVADTDDDYPQDPNRSYQSYFPNSGKQLIAFEDLWPATGDYDFNDLVLSQQVDISRNANQEIVDAQFKVSIDAIGAGHHNGIGLLLRKTDGSLFQTNLINSISGDASLDPDNTNGLIISSDVFADISSYYQNNGVGPNKAPDTLSFSISFNAGLSDNIFPELYLFRSDNRGLEVHLAGYSGSAAFDASLVNTLDDNGGFRTASGLPWAIEILSNSDWSHPEEKIDMVDAFPQFQTWASSLGSQNQTWYDFPDENKVFSQFP